MLLNNRITDGETQAGSAVFSGKVRIVDVGKMLFTNAATLIAD
jgi:hypothetical protein